MHYKHSSPFSSHGKKEEKRYKQVQEKAEKGENIALHPWGTPHPL